MTAQASHSFLAGRREYSVIDWSASFPFAPELYGLKPEMASTAAYDGFLCTFAVVDQRLVVAHLWIALRLPRNAERPRVGGRDGEFVEFGPYGCDTRYQGINLPVDYTGGMLFGEDLLDLDYPCHDLPCPWIYQSVGEVLFESGRMKSVANRSDAFRQFRAEHGPNLISQELIASWFDMKLIWYIENDFFENY